MVYCICIASIAGLQYPYFNLIYFQVYLNILFGTSLRSNVSTNELVIIQFQVMGYNVRRGIVCIYTQKRLCNITVVLEFV